LPCSISHAIVSLYLKHSTLYSILMYIPSIRGVYWSQYRHIY
jgi:hypothetical protein